MPNICSFAKMMEWFTISKTLEKSTKKTMSTTKILSTNLTTPPYITNNWSSTLIPLNTSNWFTDSNPLDSRDSTNCDMMIGSRDRILDDLG